MFKECLVYQNKVYSNFVNYINSYILLSEDPAMLEEGYIPYSLMFPMPVKVYTKLVSTARLVKGMWFTIVII